MCGVNALRCRYALIVTFLWVHSVPAPDGFLQSLHLIDEHFEAEDSAVAEALSADVDVDFARRVRLCSDHLRACCDCALVVHCSMY